MNTPRKEKILHDFFLISVWVKGVVGLLQMAIGFLLLAVNQQVVIAFVINWANPELAEDPHDLIATWLRSSAEHWGAGPHLFASVYLIIHGLIKILLIAALLRKKLWAYPVSIGVLGAFILYQSYRYTLTHSGWMIALTVLDIVVVFLILHEYRMLRSGGPSAQIEGAQADGNQSRNPSV